MEGFSIELKVNQVLLRAGTPPMDLYRVKAGALLVLKEENSSLRPLRRIGPGGFVGELAFFDGKPSLDNVVTTVGGEATQISRQEMLRLLPDWYRLLGKNLTKKIRLLEQVIGEKGLTPESDLPPLTPEEQDRFHQLITNDDT